jgi:DNA polymerase II small subunit
VPLSEPVRITRELASRGYNAEREAVTLLVNAPDPDRALERAVAAAPDDALTLTASHVRSAVETGSSTGPNIAGNAPSERDSPPETEGVAPDPRPGGATAVSGEHSPRDEPAARSVDVTNDVTGDSTGTGVYEDFVATFRDRYERLASMLRSRVNHRPTSAVAEMPGGGEAAIIQC